MSAEPISLQTAAASAMADRIPGSPTSPTSTDNSDSSMDMVIVKDAIDEESERDQAIKKYKNSIGLYTKRKFDLFKRELETKDRLDGKRMRSRTRSAGSP